MLMYFLIGLSFVLIGIVGLQFTYLFFVDRMFKERKRYLHDLERRNARLTQKLAAAERRVDEQNELLETFFADNESEDGSWADVIEDR
ncbi:MAG: hypothetical protein ABIV48_07290 [Pyrinomonadaceae bacterium]